MQLSALINPEFESPLLDKICADPDQVIRCSGEILKHDDTTTVVKIEDKGGKSWVVKRYNTKNAWHATRRSFRTSRANICWNMSHILKAAGIRVPTPLACLEHRFGPVKGLSYFVYQYVVGVDLLSYVNSSPEQRALDHVCRQIVTLFKSMQSANVNHGDMKATNLMVGVEHEIILLDLDAASKSHSAKKFSDGYLKDRNRFLQNWTNHPELVRHFERAIPK